MNRFFRSLAALLALFVATSSAHATISEEEAYEIGMEAYVYFYPIVTMEITRQMVTNAPLGKVPGFGPMNTISHMRSFPPAEFKSVTRPNFDTLYSSAFIDISNEPMILSAPDTAGRFFMMPLMDMWTDVFATPGKRATGTGGGHWAIVQPGWKGTLPKGVGRIEAPTPTVWLVARVIASGPSDYAIANKIQDGYQLTPLSRWGKPAQAVTPTIDPAVDMKTPPVVKVHNLSAKEFFALGARLMKQHPPHLTDWSQVARLERLGIVVGQDFDLDKAEPAVRAALARVPADGVKAIVDKANHRLSAEVDHWQMKTEAIGVWGNEYLRRAALAFYGLALQPPAEAIYPQAHTDADGQPLGNGNRYVLHFEKGQTPPAAEFWSVTMYGLDTFQIPNAINRFVVHDRDGLKYNADGSLDILIQPERPADESMFNNWLPAPSGGLFTLQARLYTPHRKVLEGLWTMPAVKRVP